ncbi:MAG: HD domain-containing protein [Pseudobdellovibrionaceae bacterium]
MATADIQALIQLKLDLEQKYRDEKSSARVSSYGKKKSREFSLGLEKILKKNSLWKKAQPILLGSWAEKTLTHSSDYEVLFVGDEGAVQKIMEEATQVGFPLRGRMPQSRKNWFYQCDYRDELALYLARALFPGDEKALREQLQRRKRSFPRARLLKHILEDRRGREQKYGWSVEPHLKLGPGALRDITLLKAWFKILGKRAALKNLRLISQSEERLLSVRWYLHLFGAQKTKKDQLLKEFALEVSQFFNAVDQRHFYKALFKEFQQVDRIFFEVFPKGRIQKQQHSSVMKIKDFLQTPADKIPTLFREQRLRKLIPDLERLTGYVQFDQYHLYPADKHIERACVLAAEFIEGRFSSELSEKVHEWLFRSKMMSPRDQKENREILKLLALFHDLSKGLEGDHSEVGSRRTEKILTDWGVSQEVAREVAFLVAEHLTFSHLAFRSQPGQIAVKEAIHQRGFTPRRSALLLAFTIIDILATNPTALTSWKETLLEQIWKHYISEPGLLWRGYGEIALDQILIDELGEDFLVEDLKSCEVSQQQNQSQDLRIKAVKGMIWVRLHNSQDRIGLLADWLVQLYSIGASVDQAIVMTHERIGVYDWFKVSGVSDAETLRKRWAWKQKKVEFPQYHLKKVEIIAEESAVVRILIKGDDQKGLLAYLAQVLSGLGLRIIELRATTWGQRVEDIVVIERPPMKTEELISLIQGQF